MGQSRRMRQTLMAVALAALVGCKTDVRWAIRTPSATKDCTRDCRGSPDDPAFRTCISLCGGSVKEGDECGGMVNCTEIETQKTSVVGTVVLVGLLVLGGAAVLGGLAARQP